MAEYAQRARKARTSEPPGAAPAAADHQGFQRRAAAREAGHAALLNSRPAGPRPIQRAAAPSRTGLPDRLKSGIEALSGLSMDGVRVHHNSPKPAQLDALAYAQGRDIHLAPGQERHLPHEAWHLVQQAQGRVKPTTQMKSGVAVNDDAGLEREADMRGAEALSRAHAPAPLEKAGAKLGAPSGGRSQVPDTRPGIQNSVYQLKRPNISRHYDLPVNAKGSFAGSKGGRSEFAAKPLNSLVTAGALSVDGEKFIGGHLLKDEFGGPDNASNVVPWPRAMENRYGRFEIKISERMKKRVGIDHSDKSTNKKKEEPDKSENSKKEESDLSLAPQTKTKLDNEEVTSIHFHTDARFEEWTPKRVSIGSPPRSQEEIAKILEALSDIPIYVASIIDNSYDLWFSWEEREILGNSIFIEPREDKPESAPLVLKTPPETTFSMESSSSSSNTDVKNPKEGSKHVGISELVAYFETPNIEEISQVDEDAKKKHAFYLMLYAKLGLWKSMRERKDWGSKEG